MPGRQAKVLGRWGERQAANYLQRHGWKIVAAGYATRFGEIDLIAQSRRYLAFVEVKLRRSADFAQAREFVDGRKQRRLWQAAEQYLQRHPTDRQPRFDVIEIYAPEGTAGPCSVNHIENAFEPGGWA